MSRTVSRLQGDQPFSDPTISLSPQGDIIQIAGAGTSAFTRIAAGEYSLRTATVSVAYTFVGGVSGLIFRTGIQDDYQQAFGSARAGGSVGLPPGWPQTLSTGSIVAGQLVTVNVFSTVNFFAGQYVVLDTVASGVQEFCQIQSITSATAMVLKSVVNSHTTPFPVVGNVFTTPGPRTGRPPFTGISQLTPQIASPLKGINIQQIAIIYAVNTTAITVPTVGLFATQYVNNVAPTVTTLIAQATNNLQTAAQANPYVIPVPVPVANQGFIVTPNTVVSVEFDFTTGASGSVDVLGFVVTGQYNYD